MARIRAVPTLDATESGHYFGRNIYDLQNNNEHLKRRSIMSIWCNITVVCDNPAVIKECASSLKRYNVDECEGWKDGDTVIHSSMTGHNILIYCEHIRQISQDFPDDVITYEFDNDYDMGDVYTAECRNGESIESMRAGYFCYVVHMNNERDRDEIIEKAIAFFRKLDTIETGINGETFINWVKEVVCYEFEYDGAVGKKYKVKAYKSDGYNVGFNVCEDLGKGDWQEITGPEDCIFFRGEK